MNVLDTRKQNQYNPPGWITCALCGYTRKTDHCNCIDNEPWAARLLAALLFAPRDYCDECRTQYPCDCPGQGR